LIKRDEMSTLNFGSFVSVFFLFDFCVAFTYRLWPRVILVLSTSQSASVRSRHQAVWFERRQNNAAGTVPTGCKGARSIQTLNDRLRFHDYEILKKF
jgi:hypothetical protein